jgi:capsular exopolysaccharide synthesis family protein
MTALDIFKAAARRWKLLLVFAVLGATAGFLVGPPKERAPEVGYEATHTLSSVDQTLTASRMALLMSHPDVVGPVMQEFGYPDKFSLLDSVAIAPDDATQTLAITTMQPTPERAIGITDGLAEGFIELLKAEDRAGQLEQLAVVQAEREALSAEVDGLAGPVLDGTADPTQQSQYQGLQMLLSEKLGEERKLQQEPAARAKTLIAATPREIEVGGFTTPLNRPAMLLIGLMLGAGLGIALAVVLNNVDSRVRSVADVVEAFNIPVIGQVPSLARSQRGTNEIITYEEPNSALSEAYRSIRTRLSALVEGVHHLHPQPDWRDAAIGGSNGHTRAGKVFLVTSPGVGDGKSTTVANMAAAFADAGRSVIVVSGDLRSPSIHRYLDVPDDAPGLGDDMGQMTVADVERRLQPTSLPNVRFVSHGSLVSNPGELLAANLPVIAAARALADIVLIDSPPVLAANDATELLPAVDGVLLVARLGRTRRNAARSATNLLESLGAPVLGVIALEASSDHAIYGYFGRGGKDSTPIRSHARIVRQSAEPEPAPETAGLAAAAEAPPEPHDGDDIDVPAVGSWSSWRTR